MRVIFSVLPLCGSYLPSLRAVPSKMLGNPQGCPGSSSSRCGIRLQANRSRKERAAVIHSYDYGGFWARNQRARKGVDETLPDGIEYSVDLRNLHEAKGALVRTEL